MKKNIKYVIILIVILMLLFILYYLLTIFNKKEETDEYLKDYEINEYIPTYISDEDMAKIYLNDYIKIMYSDVEQAYDLLDEKYRNIKFGSLENYKNYVNSLNYPTYEVSKYYTTSSDGYLIFGVYDKNNNFYAFKTKGVLQYSVYLDDYTVEIGD